MPSVPQRQAQPPQSLSLGRAPAGHDAPCFPAPAGCIRRGPSAWPPLTSSGPAGRRAWSTQELGVLKPRGQGDPGSHNLQSSTPLAAMAWPAADPACGKGWRLLSGPQPPKRPLDLRALLTGSPKEERPAPLQQSAASPAIATGERRRRRRGSSSQLQHFSPAAAPAARTKPQGPLHPGDWPPYPRPRGLGPQKGRGPRAGPRGPPSKGPEQVSGPGAPRLSDPRGLRA